MKKLFILILVLTATIGCSNKPPGKPGDMYQGGKIFYVDPTYRHGLVVDTVDLGLTNWEDATNICSNYRSGGYSDWRLPTKEDLNLLYKQKDTLGGFINYKYWSNEELPSKEDDDSAYYENFTNGTQGKAAQSDIYTVRAVRKF